VNPTPPCPTCGSPLRWFPEHNAWGCDRERKMLPAAVPQQPHQQPYAAAAVPRPAGAPVNKKKIIIIAAIAAVVVGGGLVAFLLLKGGGLSGGAGSPEELAKRAAKAITDGNVDDYVALSGMDDLATIISCHFPDDNMVADYREMTKAGAKRHMGIKLVVDSVEKNDDEKVKTEKAGKQIFDSCKLTKDITTYHFDVRMKDGSDVDKLKMSAMKVGDRWYFSNFDELPKSDDWSEEDDEKSMKMFKEVREKKVEKIRKATGGSPESVAKALVDAVQWGSRSRAQAMSVERYGDDFEELFKCDSYDSELSRKLEETDTMIRDLTRVEDDDDDDDSEGEDRDMKRKRVKIELVGVKVGDKDKIANGDTVLGCTANESMERAEVDVEVKVDGDKETFSGVVVKPDEAWRVLYVDKE
jgi:hypothetical protein